MGTSASVRSVPSSDLGVGDQFAHAVRDGLEAVVADANDVDLLSKAFGAGSRELESRSTIYRSRQQCLRRSLNQQQNGRSIYAQPAISRFATADRRYSAT